MWLKAVEGIGMSYSRVHHLVHYKLKAKLKVPRPVHIKLNIVESAEELLEELKKLLSELKAVINNSKEKLIVLLQRLRQK